MIPIFCNYIYIICKFIIFQIIRMRICSINSSLEYKRTDTILKLLINIIILINSACTVSTCQY